MKTNATIERTLGDIERFNSDMARIAACRHREMQTENILKASDSFGFFIQEIRAAHADAADSGNQFAEIALSSLLEEAVKLESKLNRVMVAVAPKA